jgi:hypothetical protein
MLVGNQRLKEKSDLYKKLSSEVGVVSWEALAPHAERGALFWVDKSLDLADVGVSLALDDAASVQAWHDAQLFLPAAMQSPQDFAAFRFLIIQPFVIATPMELPDPTESPIDHDG